MGKDLKCFISSPASVKTGVIRSILRSLDVLPFDAFDFKPGDEIYETVLDKIQDSDFVIAIIERPSADVYFEIGISVGLKKPLFILVDPKCMLPNVVHGYVFLRTPLEDSEILRGSLSQFIQDIIKKKKTKKKKRLSVEKKQLFEEQKNLKTYLQQIRRLRKKSQALEVENLVLSLFKELDLHVVSSLPTREVKVVDFLLWSDELEVSLGNPIIVEIKVGELNHNRLKTIEKKLVNYISASDARSGILLYLDRKGRRFQQKFSLGPLIIRWDLEDFVRSLLVQDFKDVILTARNQIVHGIPE